MKDALRFKDTLRLEGKAVLRVTDPKTGELVKTIGANNVICTVGKGLIGDMLIDVSGYDTGLTYCAIGTSAATAVASGTILTGEYFRKAITSKSRLSTEITVSTFFTATEGSANIKEAGIFGHSTAGTAKNSGIMFARWLVAFNNSSGLFDLTFDHITSIS